MIRATVVSKAYNHSCVQHRARVNSELYNALTSYRNVDDLVSLDLSKNYVGCEAGFQCILELVAGAPHLKSLNLSCTGLTTQNVADLVALALKHPCLRDLQLSMNRQYIDSGLQLVRLARFNPRIMSIDIVDQAATDVERQLANHVPPRIVTELQRHLRFNREQAAKRAATGGAATGPSPAAAARSTSWQARAAAAENAM